MAIDIEIPGYELIEEIGSGGMARVFAGTQVSLGREVAIKVLRSSLAGGEDFRRRFMHEGHMLAKLNHPNIVPIHDIGQAGGRYYMAMEYLRGGTLSGRIREGLSVAEIIRICTQVAHALNLAHEHKIVHRDLKPSNIMFRDRLTPVLTDFGIARKTDADHRLTKTGMVVGTPYYMSPEQITGKEIDGRADIYSLGVMFYELMTGDLPFRAEEPLALAMQHVQQEPPPLPDDLRELQPIMNRMLAKKPAERFPTMLDFCQAIKDLVMSEQAFAEKLSGETKIFNSDQFSDPRFGSDSLRVPERITRDVITDDRQPGATRISAESAQSVKPPALGAARRRWLWPAGGGLAALLVLSIGVFYGDLAGLFSGAGLTPEDRRMVDNLLVRVNGYIIRNQIDDPPGENAVEMLTQALEIAPGYADALKMGRQIAVFYETDARRALVAGDRDTALAKVASGLRIAPEYEPLKQIKAEIDSQVAIEEKRRKIAELLTQAQSRLDAGQLIEPDNDNALEAYQQVLALDPLNETASEGSKGIQEAVVAQARSSIEAAELEAAEEQIARAEQLFGSTSLVSAVRRELDERQRRLQEQAQVAEMLTQAGRLFEAGDLVDPPGASAVDRYQAVLRLSPGNEQAHQGLERIAAEYQRRATAALAAEDFNLSAELAASGLRALPEHPPLLAIQVRATDALGAMDREIQQTLQQAERLAQAGAFLAADGQDALNGFKRVLQLDPGNSRAQTALRQLPDRIYAAAQQLERNGEYATAQSLVTRATAAYPDDGRFTVFERRLAAAIEQQSRQQRLAAMLADSKRLIDVPELNGEAIDRAALALKKIIAEFPNDVGVVSQIGAFTQSIAAAANRLSEAGNDLQALALIQSALGQFPDNESLASARRQVNERKDQRARQEAARIAAMSGQLAIDANPWGEVIEVSGPGGTVSALPADATTPLVLSLVEGDYQVTVQGGNDAKPVRLKVTVQRQQLVRARAQFESMNAERYFERSGW